MTRRRAYWLRGGSAVLLIVGLSGVAAGQEELDPRLKQILADWAKRRAYPPMQYTVEGKCHTTKENIEAYTNARKRKVNVDVKDFGSIWNLQLLIDVPKQRHRLEEERETINISNGKITRKARISAFDGTTLMGSLRDIIDGNQVKPTADTPDVGVLTGNMGASGFPMQLAPLFAGNGVVVFPPANEILPGKLDVEPDTSSMTVHRTDVFDGQNCVVLRSFPRPGDAFVELWIDTARGHVGAVVRWLNYSAGFPIREMNVRYHAHGSYWLVASWTFESRTWFADKKQARADEIDRFNVVKTSIESEVDESRFRLAIEPGMLVMRRHIDPKTNAIKSSVTPAYTRVESSGGETSVYFEKGVEHRRWDRMYSWVAGFAALMVVTFATVYAVRRLRKAASPAGNASTS